MTIRDDWFNPQYDDPDWPPPNPEAEEEAAADAEWDRLLAEAVAALPRRAPAAPAADEALNEALITWLEDNGMTDYDQRDYVADHGGDPHEMDTP